MVGERVRAALAALEAAGSPARLRRPAPDVQPGTGYEVDLWLPRSGVTRADRALATAGFHHLRVAGQGAHRFYLGLVGGQWVKLDVKLESSRRRRKPSASPWATRRRRLRRRLPLTARRLGPVVAIVGPDGAGKGAVVDGLQQAIPVATRVIYLGLRPRASAAPAGAPADVSGNTPLGPVGWRRRFEAVLVAKGLVRHARTLLVAYAAAWQGRIVLCDRHPLEALATDPRHGRAARGLERLVVRRLLPRPDRVILLDAAPATMYARKGEHSVEQLATWRQAYLEALPPAGAEVVTTDGEVADSVDAASAIVFSALAERHRW